MPDDDALRCFGQATEAWLDVLLMTSEMALLPCEFCAQFVIAWSRLIGHDA